ncbi:helix-turn-helix transcriptional regulator [Streptomyces sp. NPDC089915]|uniref:helix-turn-helix domain-containing protein n=1 Tax=Streptomyces sp. NPDC089915 TaxID=3155186 RepID=UPI00341299BA
MESDPRRRFAEELQGARELHPGRRLTQTDVALLTRTSKSTISRVESGKGPIPPELPAILDQALGTDGLFKRLYGEMTAYSFPTTMRRRIELEQKAVAVWEWSQSLVPGLFQTPDYARAILRAGDTRASDAEVTAAVHARLARQEIFRRPVPPEARVVLCESVIHRTLGQRKVMRDQLAALLSHMERPTTRIRILGLDAEPHLLMMGEASFIISPNRAVATCIDTYRATEIVEDARYARRAQRTFEDLVGEAHSEARSMELIRAQMETLA